MRTSRQRSYDLARALKKRKPSSEGWRWGKTPTTLELAAWRAFTGRS